MSLISAIQLNPLPGFCVKSKTLQDAVVPRTATVHPTSANNPSSDTLGPTQNTPITIPTGLKIFINVAWDPNVPPPPSSSEDTIQKAMRGEHFDHLNLDAWFVPVIVSDLRYDTDKAGQPSLVIDCVFNIAIKSRTLKDPDFKAFIIELALQRVESQTSLLLSRQIGTPNIAAKGKPESRQALVPGPLFPPGHPHHKSNVKTNLIQELDTPTAALPTPTIKGILKSTSDTHTPTWTWKEVQSNICIVIDVPNMTRGDIPNSTLDVELRKVILHVPSVYDLAINLDAPGTKVGALGEGVIELRSLRDLNVDGASAEWRIAEKVIVILA